MIAGGELAVPKANGEQAGRCLVLSRGPDPSALDGLDLVATEDASGLRPRADRRQRGGDHIARRLSRTARARRADAVCPPFARTPISSCSRPTAPCSAPARSPGPTKRSADPSPGSASRFAPIYDAALAALDHPPLARTLCIGDSLAHDIAGGQGDRRRHAPRHRRHSAATRAARSSPNLVASAFVWGTSPELRSRHRRAKSLEVIDLPGRRRAGDGQERLPGMREGRTITRAPSSTREARSITSWLRSRMQPDDTARPIEDGMFVPCRR